MASLIWSYVSNLWKQYDLISFIVIRILSSLRWLDFWHFLDYLKTYQLFSLNHALRVVDSQVRENSLVPSPRLAFCSTTCLVLRAWNDTLQWHLKPYCELTSMCEWSHISGKFPGVKTQYLHYLTSGKGAIYSTGTNTTIKRVMSIRVLCLTLTMRTPGIGYPSRKNLQCYLYVYKLLYKSNCCNL